MLRDDTAGDPMRDDVRGTNLTLAEIAQRLKDAGTPVSVTVVKQLLRKHRYVQRKAQKSQTMGQHADRNQQFENIARLRQQYLESENPILSIDTKKKELVGNFLTVTIFGDANIYIQRGKRRPTGFGANFVVAVLVEVFGGTSPAVVVAAGGRAPGRKLNSNAHAGRAGGPPHANRADVDHPRSTDSSPA